MEREKINNNLIKAAKIGDDATLRSLLRIQSACGFTQPKDIDFNNAALCCAVSGGHTGAVQILLHAGADVHYDDDKPLRQASLLSTCDEVMIRILLHAGANVHAQNDYPLRYAARRGNVEIVEKLLEAGADIHAYKDQALRFAAQLGHMEMVQMLLEKRADLHTDEEGALRLAAENGHVEIVRILLQAGANVHAVDDGALRLAAKSGHVEIVRILLQAGANAHTVDGLALRLAVHEDHREIVQILLRAGANSKRIDFQDLKKFLAPKFILSCSCSVIAGIEKYYPQIKKYRWSEKITALNSTKGETCFDAKISLADLYYLPGEPGYYRAISRTE